MWSLNNCSSNGHFVCPPYHFIKLYFPSTAKIRLLLFPRNCQWLPIVLSSVIWNHNVQRFTWGSCKIVDSGVIGLGWDLGFCTSSKFPDVPKAPVLSSALFFFSLWPCWAAYWLLVPRPGVESGPQQWKRQILTTVLPGNSLDQTLSSKGLQEEPDNYGNTLGFQHLPRLIALSILDSAQSLYVWPSQAITISQMRTCFLLCFWDVSSYPCLTCLYLPQEPASLQSLLRLVSTLLIVRITLFLSYSPLAF